MGCAQLGGKDFNGSLCDKSGYDIEERVQQVFGEV